MVCYAISKAYKESTNCRLEAQYAHQREKDMVPLVVEEGYRPDGWLGMLLGVRLWYAFYGATLASNEAFESKMEELCRELGSRGEAILAPTDLGCGKPSSGLQLPRDGSGGKGRLASTMAAMVWLWRALQACGAGALLLILTRWTVKHRRA